MVRTMREWEIAQQHRQSVGAVMAVRGNGRGTCGGDASVHACLPLGSARWERRGFGDKSIAQLRQSPRHVAHPLSCLRQRICHMSDYAVAGKPHSLTAHPTQSTDSSLHHQSQDEFEATGLLMAGCKRWSSLCIPLIKAGSELALVAARHLDRRLRQKDLTALQGIWDSASSTSLRTFRST